MLRAAEDPSSAEAATVHEQNMWRFGSHVGQGGAFLPRPAWSGWGATRVSTISGEWLNFGSCLGRKSATVQTRKMAKIR
jgi:hypothetical protein